MKVGLVIYGSIDKVSGGYLYDRKLVGYLRSCGDEVEIVSIPTGSYFSHLLNNSSFRLPSDVDILIEDELVHPSVLAANGMRAPRVPVISLVHNLHSSERRAAWQNAFYRQIEKLHLRSADGFIFNSTITRDSVVQLAGKDKPNVLAPPGGDRLGSLTPDAVRARLAVPGPLRLLFLANVTPLKGLHVLLDALSALPAGCCSLDVAGSLAVDADYARQMQARAATLATPTRFHGVLDGEPLAELLAGTDLLVIPSYWEGFGISYLEGMAYGAPAIGTTAGAIPQLIRDGVNGYLVTPGDSAALARHIERLGGDRDLLMRLSLAALQTFGERPTWDQSAAAVRDFLQQMLGRRRELAMAAAR